MRRQSHRRSGIRLCRGHPDQTSRETQIPVFKQYGTVSENYKVRIKDIATVEDGYKELREFARYQGKESVHISITKNSDANVARTADMVIAKVEEIKPLLPEGYSIV